MQDSQPAFLSVQTLPQLLSLRAQTTPEVPAYREFDPSSGQWQTWTWAQVEAQVQRWSQALAASGIPAQAHIGIILPNSFHAVCIDQAAMATGCVPVPMHSIDNPGSIAYILADAQVSLLVVSQRSVWEQIQKVGLPLPHLQGVIITHPDEALQLSGTETPAVEDPSLPQVPLASLETWLEHGRHQTELPPLPGPDAMASIVYTSGTTGKPKGVVLTHRNVLSDVKAIQQRISALQDDVFLSFLPLSHMLERTCGYYLAIYAGSCVTFARSVAQLAEDMRNVRPTVMISVPRIYERVYAKLKEALAGSSFKQQLFEAAQSVGWKRFRAAQGLSDPTPQEMTGGWMCWLPWSILQKLVAQKLMDNFGGRLRVAVTGGAPLSPAIAKCFLGLGIPLVQGYGMTETSPTVSANALDDNDPMTVGRALDGVEVRIAPDTQELQVRGPIVMQGYWKRPEDTAKAFTEDGWLRTGDQAAIDNGRIRIMGRIKEIIVTSTGEKVPPGDLELAITNDPLFEQAFVVGENRPFIACVVVVQPQEWQQLAQQLSLDPQDESNLNHPSAKRAALARIERQVSGFARYAVPRAVLLTTDPWTIDNTLLTPTLKLKRNNLMHRFGEAIEMMYSQRGG